MVFTYTGKEYEVSPYSDEYKSIQHVLVLTRATASTCPHSSENIVLVLNEALWIGEKLDHTFVNTNQMRHQRIDVQDHPFIKKPMGITWPEEEVTVPLYM